MFFKKTFKFFYKEIQLEIKFFNAISGILLYLMSTVFLCYTTLHVNGCIINSNTWNTLFWIILIFIYIDSVKKTFLQERENRHIYYYSLIKPELFIFSKIFYNIILLTIISFFGFFFFTFLFGNPVKNQALFILNVVLSNIGFSSILTLISAISSKLPNNNIIMSILSIPIIIPLIIIIIHVSKNAIIGIEAASNIWYIVINIFINSIIFLLIYILFPFLWKN